MSEPRIEEAGRSEFRRVLRRLVASPLLLAEREPQAFAAVVRHRAELTRWFADHAGWPLLVDAGGGLVRLLKRTARTESTRPARAPGRAPFDRRRYTLLCLTLAALEGESLQVTLARLAESVRQLSLEDAALEAFDPGRSTERHAFVDVVRLLAALGVLTLRDGDLEAFARSRQGDALYDIRERLLGKLLAAPRPPALAGTPARMAEEDRAQTEEGERLGARHQVFRRLLDDPVLYLDEVDERTRDWLQRGSGFVYERLAEAGLRVERRAEGLAGVDPDGELTDTPFPEGHSTVKHAALLLSAWLADVARAARGGHLPSPVVTMEAVVARVAELRAEHAGQWSKAYGDDEAGAAELASDALRVLQGFGLAAPVAGGFAARPAAARFAPREAAP